jgi:hypothetical protein
MLWIGPNEQLISLAKSQSRGTFVSMNKSLDSGHIYNDPFNAQQY